ncbi:MAG: hypothetical protein RL642_633 [Bacteroidota bacterium]|jgi:hypothetical protein
MSLSDKSSIVNKNEFFNSYWSELDSNGWRSAVLHTWKDLPEKIESDVDYVIADCNPHEMLTHLCSYCIKQGWRLAQVIEHEPCAYYCTCIQYGKMFETISLDVTWNYRRRGHSLINGKTLLFGRKKAAGKSFWVPSPGAEAMYIITKAVAKSKDFDVVKGRLKELVDEDKSDIQRFLVEVFSFYSPTDEAPEDLLRRLEAWFYSNPYFKKIRNRRRFGKNEFLLYLRRLFHPTGLCIYYNQVILENEILNKVISCISPFFRRSIYVRSKWPFTLPKIVLDIIRTSLVIDCAIGKRIFNTRNFCRMPSSVTLDDQVYCVINYMEQRVKKRICKINTKR